MINLILFTNLKNLIQLTKENSKKCFITSHYLFITLVVFHYASVINNVQNTQNTQSIYNDYLDMKNLTAYYLTPNTRKKEVILSLYEKFGTTLSSLNTSLLADTHGIHNLNEHVSDIEKLWAFLCRDQLTIKSQVKSFLDNEIFGKYSKLG